jgi:chorismate mutase
MNDELVLSNIRSNLIRQEETIIFALIERAQFSANVKIYEDEGVTVPGYKGSFMMYLLSETEKIHASVRRYTASDEHPFTKHLPDPLLTPMVYDWPIKMTSVNINNKILKTYVKEIIPMICEDKDDGNYGSSAVCDINVLQALSKRIHYGKFVAESKYIVEPAAYDILISNEDKKGLIEKLTDKSVEEKLLKRVALKASTYGQEPDAEDPVFKIEPNIIKKIYSDLIIKMTKEVEYLYLMERGRS